MKLTLLGVNGPFPSAGGACSSYLLETDTTKILMDCGSGALAQLLKHVDLADIDAIIISHWHADHVSDMLVMRYLLDSTRWEESISVYAPVLPEPYKLLLNSTKYTFIHVDEPFTIGDVDISFIHVRHPITARAVKVTKNGRSICYTGDTNTCDGLDAFIDQCDILLCDTGVMHSAWSEKSPHLSAKLVGELALKANVKQLICTHINPRIDATKLLNEASVAFPNAKLARIDDYYYV